MNLVNVLKEEESKLQRQLKAVQAALAALNGAVKASSPNGTRKRTISAAGRARIARAAKARWAKFRAERAKKAK